MRDWMWFAGDGDIAAEGRCYNIFIVFSIGIEGEGGVSGCWPNHSGSSFISSLGG